MGPRFESGLLHHDYGAVAQWVEPCFFTDCRRKLPELEGESDARDHIQRNRTRNRGAGEAWTKGVPLEDAARKQLLNAAQLAFIFKWIAAMPDVHWGIGATVGSVIPTKGAIIPAAVGVDIGCGMMAVQTSLNARDLRDNLKGIRSAIERAVPHGRTNQGGAGDRGAWHDIPQRNQEVWLGDLKARYDAILAKHPKLDRGNHANHLGTLGTGKHFIEVCLDESETVWFMLHSGSRGVGNRMGSYFIDVARKDMKKFFVNLPDVDLAYFPEHTEHFDDYVEAVEWAQDYARRNRDLMMEQIVGAVRNSGALPLFNAELKAINCHHNYVARESHFGENVLITRKGAVRAREGDMGIIPGSMGATRNSPWVERFARFCWSSLQIRSRPIAVASV